MKTGIFSLPEKQEIVCMDEIVPATCPVNNNIIIKEATYGHISLSKCIEVDTGYLGCKVDVLDLLSERCNGKQNCEINEDDDELRKKNPCRKGLLLFLQFSYICVPGRSKSWNIWCLKNELKLIDMAQSIQWMDQILFGGVNKDIGIGK